MKSLLVAFALVLCTTSVYAAHIRNATPHCHFNYTNRENENINWDKLDAIFFTNGVCLTPTTTTLAPTTTTTAAPTTTTTAAPTTTTAAPTTTTTVTSTTTTTL